MNIETLSVPPAIKAELPKVMETFKIDTPLRLAHFLAQCAHESGGFKTFSENLNYSDTGLLTTFGKYFNKEQALKYARNPEAIASRVYANRLGNGNEDSRDGWRYRGRGAIQLTGKANYAEFDKFVPENIVGDPDLVAKQYPLLSAAWFWHTRNINASADIDNITTVTKKVNGGLHGIVSRQDYLRKFKKDLGIQ